MKTMWKWEFALKYANVYHSCSFFVGMTPWLLHPALHRWMQQRCGSLSSLLESQLQATQLWYAWVVAGWLTLLAIFSILFWYRVWFIDSNCCRYSCVLHFLTRWTPAVWHRCFPLQPTLQISVIWLTRTIVVGASITGGNGSDCPWLRNWILDVAAQIGHAEWLSIARTHTHKAPQLKLLSLHCSLYAKNGGVPRPW